MSVKAKAIALAMLLVPQAVLGQVSSDLGAAQPPKTLRPAASPSMSIGQNGGPEYELFQVAGAVRLSDGRIVVLNAGSGQVAVFSAAGRHLASHGGVGEGPGEFARAARLFLGRGDSLFVWDSRTLRITVLTADGGLARTIRLHPHPEAPRLEGIDAQGKILVVASHFEGPSPAGISRLPESYLLYAGDGSRVDSLGQAPGMAGVIRASSERVEVLRPLVSPTTSYALAGGRLWIATGEAHRVGVLDLETKMERVITWAGPDLRMKDGYAAAIIRERLRDVVDEAARDRLRMSLEARPVPDMLPATLRVLAEPSGRGWVELAPLPGAEGPSEWLVLSPDGALLARVLIPRRMSPQVVSENDLLVVERDEWGLEYVRLYRLEAVR